MKIGRNSPCHCGSGEKYKKCCLDTDDQEKSHQLMLINQFNASEQVASLERLIPELGLDEPEDSSNEFKALEAWVDDYSIQIDQNHPFQAYLRDPKVTHSSLIEIAKIYGLSEYYEKAQILYDIWELTLKSEVPKLSI